MIILLNKISDSIRNDKHYVAVGLGRDNQNGNGHIKLNIPISVNTKGHCRNYLKENSLTMNEISCTVYCPILCGMIEHVNHRGNTRIQFHSADSGFMPLHQDHGGERAHEYIKCSYMETGVGLTYSGRDSKNSIEELDFAIGTIFANKLKKYNF